MKCNCKDVIFIHLPQSFVLWTSVLLDYTFSRMWTLRSFYEVCLAVANVLSPAEMWFLKPSWNLGRKFEMAWEIVSNNINEPSRASRCTPYPFLLISWCSFPLERLPAKRCHNGPIDPSKVGALMNVSDLESKGEEVSHDTHPESLQCLKGRHSSKPLKLREVLKQLRKIEKKYIIS